MTDVKFYDVFMDALKEQDSKNKEAKAIKDKNNEIIKLKLELEDVRYKAYKEGYDDGVDAGFWMAITGMNKYGKNFKTRKEDVR